MKPEDVSSDERDWTQYYRPDDHYLIGREEVREFARSMKDGHIVEQGNHDELLAAGGFYAKLYNSQFEGVET